MKVISKVIGDGKTIETARRPEIAVEKIGWKIVEDLGDKMVIEIDDKDKDKSLKYKDTKEYGDSI